MARTIVINILLLFVGGWGGVLGSTDSMALFVGGLAGSFLEGWVDAGGMSGVESSGGSRGLSLRSFVSFGTSARSDFDRSET